MCKSVKVLPSLQLVGARLPPPRLWRGAHNWWVIMIAWDLVYSLSEPDFWIFSMMWIDYVSCALTKLLVSYFCKNCASSTVEQWHRRILCKHAVHVRKNKLHENQMQMLHLPFWQCVWTFICIIGCFVVYWINVVLLSHASSLPPVTQIFAMAVCLIVCLSENMSYYSLGILVVTCHVVERTVFTCASRV